MDNNIENLDSFDFDAVLDEFIDEFENSKQFPNESDNTNQNSNMEPFNNQHDTSFPSSECDGREGRGSLKHTRDELIDYLNDGCMSTLTSFGECDEKDMLKVMRIGSLDRIIASSVVARRSSSDVLLPPINPRNKTIDHEGNIKKTIDKFLKALKNSDMHGLAMIISEVCTDTSFLTTPDLSEPACRKSRIMMYFALIFESYPDAIWKIQSQNISIPTVSVFFTFTGTCVFDQSIDCLFKYIDMHVMKKIDETDINGMDNAEYEYVVSHVSEYIRVPPPPMTQPSSPRLDAKSLVDQTADSSLSNGHNDDGVIRVNSVSRVSVSSIPLNTIKGSTTQVQSSGPLQRMSSNGNKEDSVLSALSSPLIGLLQGGSTSIQVVDPKVRELANKALKQGTIKQHRRMDIVFNDMDQIVRIIIC